MFSSLTRTCISGGRALKIAANRAIFSLIDAVIRALRRTRVSGAVTLSNFSVPADVTVTLPKPLSLLPPDTGGMSVNRPVTR
jgi:hypothetical protein